MADLFNDAHEQSKDLHENMDKIRYHLVNIRSDIRQARNPAKHQLSEADVLSRLDSAYWRLVSLIGKHPND